MSGNIDLKLIFSGMTPAAGDNACTLTAGK